MYINFIIYEIYRGHNSDLALRHRPVEQGVELLLGSSEFQLSADICEPYIELLL